MEENQPQNNNVLNSPKESYTGVGSFMFEIIKIFALAFIVITPIRIFLFQPFFVQGASMEPNFEDGEYLIINELGYKSTNIGIGDKSLFTVDSFKELKREDVIVFRYPKDQKQYFIKRVIGLPGEKVKIADGEVHIFNKENPNGFILDESGYLPKSVHTAGELTEQLGPDEYFVMGDNRSYSHDSRSWGPVNNKFVIGKVLVRAWPFSKAEIY
jgi:signal peptidase I